MDIKGRFKYVEAKPEEDSTKKEVLNFGSKYLHVKNPKPISESTYFKENRDILFAFKPLNSKEKIKENFLNQLKKLKIFEESLISHIDEIESERLVKLVYFDVFYCKVSEASYVKTKRSYSSYKKPGEYTIEVSDDGRTYSVTPKYERYSTTKSSTYTIKEDRLIYCSKFSRTFYSTKAVDQTRLVNDDDLPGLEYEESKDIISLAEKELKAVSIKGLELVQVLLFPIWKIEFEYDGGNYFTYISDFSGEMVLNQGERIPGSSLPVLLTKRTMAWKRCRKFANNLKVFFTGLFYVADILAGVAYALLAQKHAGEKESWGWFFIHLGLLIIAGISFANCHKTFYTNLEENRKKGFLRASLIPLTFSLLSLLILGLGIALTFLFPPEIVW